ncbi:MAG TPA: hypothetical protein VFF98_12705 [Novosphingobium sp.]|nr:hypothetical protein [Novosphingobium sp.]
MAGGVSPISPVTASGPQSKYVYAATAVSPSVPKASDFGDNRPKGLAPIVDVSPTPPKDPTNINIMA